MMASRIMINLRRSSARGGNYLTPPSDPRPSARPWAERLHSRVHSEHQLASQVFDIGASGPYDHEDWRDNQIREGRGRSAAMDDGAEVIELSDISHRKNVTTDA